MHEAPDFQNCEVIILTALSLEYQAVMAHLQDVQEIVHPQGTIYQMGSFPGRGRIWRVAVAEIGMGGVSAATETERAISFFEPQITLFVGIAGGLKDVQLGDVVAATKVYAYESGKVASTSESRPELWRASHPLEQRARAEARSTDWLTRLDGSRPAPEPQVYIGALAAGEKVIASKKSVVYRLLQGTYGDALAVEMEGHGFLQAVRVNHSVHALVVRSISDRLDDKSTADAAGVREHAARHAAAFAFHVLANFTLPDSQRYSVPFATNNAASPDASNNASSTPIVAFSLRNIPFARNSFFTGRERELHQLHEYLWQNRSAAIGQTQAVSGLGGIGKTQLAVEYAYRYHQEYQTILWAHADTPDMLNASYSEIATLLNLPERAAQKQDVLVQAVKHWLQTHQGWLLILDNADNPDVLPAFLPPVVGGHLLITTRAVVLRRLGMASPLAIETFTPEQGALFLLHRSGLLASHAFLEQAVESDRQLARQIARELGGLPLALEQASAYLDATATDLATYWQIYQAHRVELLKRDQPLSYSKTVATTWEISFQEVERKDPAAADLLRFCAFFAPDAIPEEILTRGASELGPVLAPIAADAYQFNAAIESLRAYSLVTRDPHEHTLTVHRLVQTVLRDSLSTEVQQEWMQRVVLAMNAALPDMEFGNWLVYERCLPHVLLLCATWIEQALIVDTKTARLLNDTGYYLRERGRYVEAENLYKRALRICEKQLGTQHSGTAVVLNNLAVLYESQSRYAEAEALYKRALKICEKQLGTQHSQTACILNSLAALYRAQGRYAKAEALHERALKIMEEQLGVKHRATMTSLNDLAMLYQAQGKYVEAETLYKRAFKIREEQLGTQHPDTARSLNNLAVLYQVQGRCAEAEPLYERTLTIYKEQLGIQHSDTARSLNNLATLYESQGRSAEAEPLYEQALKIREEQLGVEHPHTVSTLCNLAYLYDQQGRYADSEPLYQRIIAICVHVLGEKNPATQNLKSYYEQLHLLMRQNKKEDMCNDGDII